ncbi:MAG: class I SAM-dependent methyltransferase [Pseudomonadota bacterium]
MKLTTAAHNIVRQHIPAGGFAIDATAGNGHDTLFLATCVGPEGHVFAFDTQHHAIANTRQRVTGAHLDTRVTLICASHTELVERLPPDCRQRVSAVMFNLGYLPGGDKAVTTQLDSTLVALEAAMQILSDNGVLSVMAYRGHAGGISEFAGVASWVSAQQARYGLIAHQESPNGGPAWWLLSR